MPRLLALLTLALALSAPAYADDDAKAASKEAAVPKEETSVTHHSVSVAGAGNDSYSATAAHLLIRDD